MNILVGMSGGVDSSTAALMLKEQGHKVIGVTMAIYRGKLNTTTSYKCGGACYSADEKEDIEAARNICNQIGIEYYVFDCVEKYNEIVLEKFKKEYLSGRTPNPCVWCNSLIKFDVLPRIAGLNGIEFDKFATGHYARISYDENSGKYILKKALDSSKDQSYVLYSLTQEQLANTCFPLGDYSKTEIRKIAEEQGFFNAHKHDSQDICFIPDGDYMSFIEKTTGKKSEPGDFVNQEGEVVGRHKGYYGYTIGQRKGLGISAPKPYYVTEIRPEENKVIVGSNEDLFKTDLIANDFNWIENLAEDEVVKARIRYHQTEKEATARKNSDGTFR